MKIKNGLKITRWILKKVLNAPITPPWNVSPVTRRLRRKSGKDLVQPGASDCSFHFQRWNFFFIDFNSFVTKLIIDDIIDPWGYLYTQIQAFNKRYGRVCLKLVLCFIAWSWGIIWLHWKFEIKARQKLIILLAVHWTLACCQI